MLFSLRRIINVADNIHLVIPDSHAHPNFDNKRYTYLGHLISDIKPDVVIDIGDWWDMPSLNSFDTKGKKYFEGRNYKKDIEAGLDANDRMLTIIRRKKRKLPRFVRCLGNHEYRIIKAIENDPVLDGTIGLDDLCSGDFGWEEHSFLQPIEIDGIHYSHYFIAGVSGKALGGVNHARALVLKYHRSVTQGHSHLHDHSIVTDVGGVKLHGCVVGCYQDYESDWAGPANILWDAGVVIKRGVNNGQYDLEWVSMKRIVEAYKNCGD